MGNPHQVTLDELLAHESWVRQLASALVLDPAGADEVVQETWRRILERPPRDLREPRAWLTTVVKRVAAGLHRGEARRRAREAAAARPEAVSADRLDRAELHRDLVRALLELPDT